MSHEIFIWLSLKKNFRLHHGYTKADVRADKSTIIDFFGISWQHKSDSAEMIAHPFPAATVTVSFN